MDEQKKEATVETAISKICSKCGHHPKKATFKYCTRCGSQLTVMSAAELIKSSTLEEKETTAGTVVDKITLAIDGEQIAKNYSRFSESQR